ncbi:hypothetical protein LXA47_03860 [Massilia sp. P8910]|uniref:hypothetical protein n=1 Tax=Massilia antarctica TaxID=2765360 RepID=UPI001E531CF9|nr:hypothetical protein [Massilia antarctica]MCE3602733.1 hypothetical protein [Massilia antarctica]
MTPRTKTEIEGELLKSHHDVRQACGNERDFSLRAEMASDPEEKRRSESTARYYAGAKARALHHINCLNALVEAHVYHALSVRDNAIDRKWAAKLSAPL